MTAFRRKTKIRGRPMGPLDLNVIFDICNKSRAHGNHQKCSATRKAMAEERRAKENKS
ncbi:hypothetical protein [Pseudomonas sp. PS01300]|uniref:hypothetical protein n=1 Tax=Pseudomonas sp. PS01300 TaxID=2991436 RepID=UPI00249ADACD|nr:hypothetical protein [Pseudomonas sp. PS01300]